MLSTGRPHCPSPAVDVGATVICESEELLEALYPGNIWHIQSQHSRRLPGPRSRSARRPRHTQSWHNFKPVKPVEVAPNHWRWELKDMPALTCATFLPSGMGRARRPHVRPVGRCRGRALTTSGAPSASGSPRSKPTAPIHPLKSPPRRKASSPARPTSTPSSAASPTSSRKTSATSSS
jgi:hypothetical protein